MTTLQQEIRETTIDIRIVPVTARINVALETLQHTYLLEERDLPNSIEETMVQLKRWQSSVSGTYESAMVWMLCKTYCIKIGTLGSCSKIFQNDFEMRTARPLREALFTSLTRDEVLTRGFARPCLLSNSEDFLTGTIMSCRTDVRPSNARRAVVVCLELEKDRLVYAFLLSVTLGVVIAVVVGFVKHDFGLGATMGGTIAGFLALLHFIVVWKYSQP